MSRTSEENHNAHARASNSARPQILKDLNSKERVRPWKARKNQSNAVAQAFSERGKKSQKNYERTMMCADVLTFERLKEQATGREKLRLTNSWFCKHRLCAMCQWRRSNLLGSQAASVLQEHLECCPTDRVIMLTLTAKSTGPRGLSSGVSELSKAFRRLSEQTAFKRATKGWLRSVEVTRNEEKGTYHPHIHVLLVVPALYFHKAFSLYLRTEQWVEMWRKALRVDYTPVCDVRVIGGARAKGFTQEVRKGLAEVTKYCTKPGDWVQEVEGTGMFYVDPKVLGELETGLRSKRLVGWGGVLRDIYKAQEQEDIEDADADLGGRRRPVPEGWVSCGFETYGFVRLDLGGNYYLRRTEAREEPPTGPPRNADPPTVH